MILVKFCIILKNFLYGVKKFSDPFNANTQKLIRSNIGYDDYFQICVPCQCNLHSNKCHPTNGTCLNCEHNTRGASCHKCMIGYYGDPTMGTEMDCKPCACPGGLFKKNQFSKECVLNELGAVEPYRCLKCDQGLGIF